MSCHAICGAQLAFAAGISARVLTAAIALVTTAAFLGRFSFQPVAPADGHLGALVVVPGWSA